MPANKKTLHRYIELAKVCKLSYGDSVRHTNYSYQDTPFKHQLIINGTFGRGFCRLFWHEETLVVAFRGCRRSVDWGISNFQSMPALLKDCADADSIKVHSGFQKKLDMGEVEADIRALDEIFNRLKQYDLMNTDIAITGHSLGGALAVLFATKLRCMFPQLAAEHLKEVVTFSAPAVGNQGFREYYGDLNDMTVRVINKRDPIPLTPVLFYQHVGTEHCLQNNAIMPSAMPSTKTTKSFVKGLGALLLTKRADYAIDTYIDLLTEQWESI